MHEESALLQFAHTLHWYALAFMGLVYILRITWFVKRFKAGGERQAATGIPGRTTPSKGVVYSLGNIMMPWAMESSRKRPIFYIQFVAFHLGVTSAILLLFIIPLAPGLAGKPGHGLGASGVHRSRLPRGVGPYRSPVRGQAHEGDQLP